MCMEMYGNGAGIVIQKEILAAHKLTLRVLTLAGTEFVVVVPGIILQNPADQETEILHHRTEKPIRLDSGL